MKQSTKSVIVAFFIFSSCELKIKKHCIYECFDKDNNELVYKFNSMDKRFRTIFDAGNGTIEMRFYDLISCEMINVSGYAGDEEFICKCM